MSSNPISGNPFAPLSIGNVVTAGVRLYRSRLKTYLQLALTAYLWVLVPIYGWAKFAAISGLISRLAFGELTSQPESVKTARSQIKPRLWSFLRVSFQVWISLFLVYVVLAILSGILAGILAAIFGVILGPTGAAIGVTLGVILLIGIVLFGVTWYYSRWMVAEVPLAIEEGVNGGKSVARSWELTKGAVFRIQGIVLVTFVVTFPIVFLFTYLPQIFLFTAKQGSPIYWIIYSISSFASLVGGIFVMPFWQTIKAVLYYDLRSRREGFGLHLRDR